MTDGKGYSGDFRLSIVMPVWRESGNIRQALQRLQPLRDAGHEIIVVDGGSDDGTPRLAEGLCDRVLISELGRARQMNAGAGAAKGDLLLFLHADTLLPSSAPDYLSDFWLSKQAWGRFDVRLSGHKSIYRVIAWFMNHRSRLTGVATGDQAMFVRRSVFEALRGFADIPLMEDIELSTRLKRVSRPWCVSTPVVTDSRRWEQGGAWRTIWLMWRLRWRYWRGEPADKLAAEYRGDVRNDSSG